VLGASFGFLGEAANSVGAYVAGTWPKGAGMNATQMLASPRQAYVLLNVEPELDCYDAPQALNAVMQAKMVVALSAFKHHAADYADVMLPIAPFTETSGSFVNTEGRVQSFNAVAKPRGETRPAWKVLRVLGNLLNLPGFDFNSSEQVRAEALPSGDSGSLLDNHLQQAFNAGLEAKQNGIERIGEVPIYQADALVRRAPSLQQTRDAKPPQAWINAALMQQLGLEAGATIRLKQGSGEAQVMVACDDRLPNNCVRIAGAHPTTMHLGGLFGAITVECA